MVYEQFKDPLAVVATISTILQFLSGVVVCRTILKKGGTGDISGFPFVAGTLGCALWLLYGYLLRDTAMVLVNIVGTVLQGLYTVIYYKYTKSKTVVSKQILGSSALVFVSFLYVYQYPDDPVVKPQIGLLCCGITFVVCGAPLASLAHVVHTKCTESLPFYLILATFLVCLEWYLYGVILEDTLVQIPNIIGALLSGSQLCLFCIYPNTLPSKVLLS